MHIALFGGSFDPPHLGHVLCACYAYVHGEVDRVWVLPVKDHPYGKDLASWDNRWDLCHAAFGKLGFVELRDDELDNSGGRTINLVQHLQDTHRNDTFALIGGTDTENDLPNWYRGSELAEIVSVIAVPRRAFDDEHPAALPAISSTAVREAILKGDDTSTMLSPRVRELIEARGLYR
ncbi:MAG: nicotinate-nicotinamide nucleotide adenylyltransferase [Planctomycetota bacterium]|jgi:nicotinate-nucleotide adenylyltransferase|nr:nicotinate-nicotinamide nucleotide adenylyltransferase [Planctomycetota bacterium]